MQFCKLRYFLKLINACHTCNLLTIKTVLMTLTTIALPPLLQLLLLLLSTSTFVGATATYTTSKALNVFEDELQNIMTAAATPSSPAPSSPASETYPRYSLNNNSTNSSSSISSISLTNADFEQILSAQLKREEQAPKLKTQTGYTANGDYDKSAAVTPQSPAPPSSPALARKSLLSRKRRYLLFPEGTSFQVVYDGIIGIVDYTNYLILGITLALAWELPTKAPSEQLEDIKQQVEDGTLFLPRNDTATNITYVDTKSKKKFSQNQQKITFKQSMKPNYINMASYQQHKTNYNTKPYYDYYYSNNYNKHKRPILQPVFVPPMHRNYYYQRPNQSPTYYGQQTTYRKARPGSSMKYAYSFQKQPSSSSSSSTARQRQDNHYRRYYYGNDGKEQAGDWRRKDNYYYKQASGNSSQSSHPFKKWLSPKVAYTTPYDQTKYPWWNLATRLTNSFRRKGATKAQQARQFTNVNNARSNQQQEKQSSESGYYQSNALSTPASLSATVSSMAAAAASMSSSSPTPSPTPTPKRKATTASSIPRKHRIYPVFGKRSLPDNQHRRSQPAAATLQPQSAQHPQHQQQQKQKQHNRSHRHRRCGIDSDELSKFDRIHIRHHRHTRHTLYQKIEKYLDKRGSHGHHCVLRALCETAHKAKEQEPGSFLGELMRAVFTLPEPVDEDIPKLQYRETRYDAAHAFEGNCGTRYFHCKDSLWKSHFIA